MNSSLHFHTFTAFKCLKHTPPQYYGGWAPLYGDNYLGWQQSGLLAPVSWHHRQQSEPGALSMFSVALKWECRKEPTRRYSPWWVIVKTGFGFLPRCTAVFQCLLTASFRLQEALPALHSDAEADRPAVTEVKWITVGLILQDKLSSPPWSGQYEKDVKGRYTEICAAVELIMKLH